MPKPYLLRISSQKGGVGKTTIAVNLSTALAQQGFRVLIVDADTTNPSVGFHLGIDEVNTGIREVMSGKSSLRNTVIRHNTTGMHVLPGTAYSMPFVPAKESIERFMGMLAKESYDFIIVDTAPGTGIMDVFKMYDEAIIISSPEMSACASSIRLAAAYDKEKLKHSLILNRVRNRKYEISVREIEEMYGDRVRSSIPEDEIVPISISEHIPAIILDGKTRFSTAVKEMSGIYAASTGTEAYRRTKRGRSIIAFLRRIFGIW